jgi:hypothetical protein
MAQQFFYDAQIERFLAQFIRMVSGFQVEFGKDRNGNTTLQRVPVYYGDGSRQVMAVITGNSENTLPTTPAMTVYINNFTYDRDRVQEPNFISKMNIRQRYYNEDSQEYENQQGNAFTVERMMPVPYTLELKLDIWTSNTKQKLQLLEQLIVLFNPALEIQSTDNYIDWTSLSVVYLESPNWSSRTVGTAGAENPIDVATLTFKLPIWISAPAKVKKLGVIQKIISSIHDGAGDLSDAVYSNTNLMGSKQYFTPMDYGVLLIGNTLTLLKVHELEDPRDPPIELGAPPVITIPVKVGTPDNWRNLIGVYGSLENGISQIRLLQEDELSEIVGTVSYHPTDDTLLIFNADIDTYPANTLNSINAIIDPRKVTVDSSITNPTAGTRYLILHDIGSEENANLSGASAWAGSGNVDLVAHANDIIEYNGSVWAVSFDSQAANTVQYVSNLNTTTQYKWDLNRWVKSWEGEYKNGLWTLVL